jgi:hypothetical protein
MEGDLVYYMTAQIRNKNRLTPAFDSQYSIFPAFHYSMCYLPAKTTSLR